MLAKERNTESGDNKYLVAYYVSDESLSDDLLIHHLNQSLPDYMIPSAFVQLETFPLTINGKLDRKALPDPVFTSTDRYVAPTNELEAEICNLWQSLLGLDQVGVSDDFFNVGGDSILSIQLSSRLRQLGYRCSVKDIFDHRTIAKLSHHIASIDEVIEIKTEQGILEGCFDLLPIQDWFFKKKDSDTFEKPSHWNQSFLVNVPELDMDPLQSCIEKLVHQHDMLSVTFDQNEAGIYTQTYHASMAIPELKTIDVSTHDDASLHKTLTKWQSHFDIENNTQWPLWQIAYLHGYGDGSARVYFALHHLIIDAVSWRILIDDLKDLYEGKSLLAKTSSYRQWVDTVTVYPKNNPTEQSYWEDVLNSTPDYSHHPTTMPSIAEAKLSLTDTQSFLQQANQAYHTEINDLLLTALAYALQAWNNENIQGITLEGHGRESLDQHIDTNKTIGWFTSMYPVKLALKSTLRESIKFIKESLREIPNKGIGFGPFTQAKGNDLSTSQLPPISFNYLGQFGAEKGAEPKNKKTQSKRWHLSNESSGLPMHEANHDENIININGMVVNGALNFSVVTQLGEEATQSISQSLQVALETITAHCDEVVRNKVQEYTPSDFDDYIPYEIINKSESTEKPLFFLPPGVGGAESYFNNLALNLNDKKLILFNNWFEYLNKNKGEKSIENVSYEELASLYILHIKRIQPIGPYQLIGWSFGGVLAFEIARQLIEDSNLVSRVVLIDSYFNHKQASSMALSDTLNQKHKKNINHKYRPKKMDLFPLRLFYLNEMAIIPRYVFVRYQ